MTTGSIVVSFIAIIGIILVLILFLRFVPLGIVDLGAGSGRARAHRLFDRHALPPRQPL